MKRIELWKAKLKTAQAELKIVTRKANSLNKRQATLVDLIDELEKKIATAILAKA